MTSEEKKLTLRRIVIFTVLCFIPNYILEIAFSDHNGGLTSAAAGQTIMLYPAVANILTRIITKEGKGEYYLKARLKAHKGIYIAAAVLPLVMGLVNMLVIHFLFDAGTDMAELFDKNTNGKGLSFALALLCLTYLQDIPLLILGFGEEFGWRAYLTPKLEKFMPRLPACCITGIIWGLWHAPLIWYGYDFGRGYAGFPYVGVIAMCVVCMPLSYLLTYMTEKTKSVFPAAICHTAIDSVMNIPVTAAVSRDALTDNSLWVGIILMGLVPTLLTCILLTARFTARKTAE